MKLKHGGQVGGMSEALADLARITSYIKGQSGPDAGADTASAPPLKLSASARTSRMGTAGSFRLVPRGETVQVWS